MIANSRLSLGTISIDGNAPRCPRPFFQSDDLCFGEHCAGRGDVFPKAARRRLKQIASSGSGKSTIESMLVNDLGVGARWR